MESKTFKGRFCLRLAAVLGVDLRLILQLYRHTQACDWQGGGTSESRHLRDRLIVLEELIGRNHGDAIPGADLVAEGAANAAGEIDGADLEDDLVARAGDDVDAIDGADGHAGFAAGTHVLVEEGQNFGELFLGHYV
jgi:hypothetical protein